MLPFSSSIFNSDTLWRRRPAPLGHAWLRRRILSILLWTLGAVFLLDIVTGLLFRPPTDPRRPLTSLQAYFEYGRTLEGKLRRIVGVTPSEDAAIVHAGWIERECDIASATPSGKLGIDIYGSSFSNHIADHMERLDSGIVIRRFAGPGAPPSHSYACITRRDEAKQDLAAIQILSILGSSLPRMQTLGGLTTSFEAPQPFTYPRYKSNPDGHLVANWPSIRTQEDLRATLADPNKWRDFLTELAAGDDFYGEALVRSGLSDYSVIARMIRRAWAQRLLRNHTDALRATDGFSGAPEMPRILRTMLFDFAGRARAAGARPIVILIEDRGYGGVLSATIVPTLKANDIEFVITSTLASPYDPSNFVSDGHFTPSVDAKFAREVLKLLGREG